MQYLRLLHDSLSNYHFFFWVPPGILEGLLSEEEAHICSCCCDMPQCWRGWHLWGGGHRWICLWWGICTSLYVLHFHDSAVVPHLAPHQTKKPAQRLTHNVTHKYSTVYFTPKTLYLWFVCHCRPEIQVFFIFIKAALEEHCTLMLSQDSSTRHQLVSEQQLSTKVKFDILKTW